MRLRAPHQPRARVLCHCCVQVSASLFCAQGDIPTFMLAKRAPPHLPTPGANVHIPHQDACTLPSAVVPPLATCAKSDTKGSWNCTAGSSHTLLALASYRKRRLRKRVKLKTQKENQTCGAPSEPMARYHPPTPVTWLSTRGETSEGR